MGFQLPTTPLGNFVKQHYKEPLQAGAFRKLRKNGFTPPGTTASGTAPATTRGTARDRLLPPELIGVSGVRGAFAPGFTPRLNPNDFVVHTNDRGRTFWEPITETTGMSPINKGQLKSFDAASVGQRPIIQGAYSDLQGSLNANADATKARLASLGSLIQSQPLVAGAVQGVPDAQARLADTARQGQAADAAVTVGQMSALPAIAATEGTKTLTGWDATRQKDREALISGIRSSEQEAAAAALEAKQGQSEIAAQLRGQDLQLLGTQTTQAGGLQRALIQSDTTLQTKQAELENRLLIAELQGDVATANNIRSTMAQLQSAAIRAAASAKTGGSGRKAKDTAAFVKKVRASLTGAQIKNPAYDAIKNPGVPQFITKPGASDPEGVIRDAVTQGVSVVPVLRAIRAVDPTWGGKTRQDAQALYEVLVGSGMPSAQAFKVAKSFIGVSPTISSSG